MWRRLAMWGSLVVLSRVIVFPPQGCLAMLDRLALVGKCGCVGPFGHVGPCGYVSTSRTFGHVGPVGHLVFRLDVVAANYFTKGKRSTRWSSGWMQ